MSHSRIIQLSPVPVTEENRLDYEDLFDDYIVNAVSCSVKDCEDEEKELDDLKFDAAIKDVAVRDGRRLVPLGKDTVRDNYLDWFSSCIGKASDASLPLITPFSDIPLKMRNLFSDYKEDTNLFVITNIRPGSASHMTLRSAEFVGFMAENPFNVGVWYIGAIIDSKDA